MKTRMITFLLNMLLFGIGLIGQDTNNPCSSMQHRQFDFWLGEWDVYTNDTIAGTSSIVLSQDGCLLIENWESAKGAYAGTSYNFFHADANTWHQTWVDNQGGSLLLNGNFINGQMILISEPFEDKKGDSILHRITWTPEADGIVRQLWEMSKNDEKWIVLFDGTYRRK